MKKWFLLGFMLWLVFQMIVGSISAQNPRDCGQGLCVEYDPVAIQAHVLPVYDFPTSIYLGDANYFQNELYVWNPTWRDTAVRVSNGVATFISIDPTQTVQVPTIPNTVSCSLMQIGLEVSAAVSITYSSCIPPIGMSTFDYLDTCTYIGFYFGRDPNFGSTSVWGWDCTNPTTPPGGQVQIDVNGMVIDVDDDPGCIIVYGVHDSYASLCWMDSEDQDTLLFEVHAENDDGEIALVYVQEIPIEECFNAGRCDNFTGEWFRVDSLGVHDINGEETGGFELIVQLTDGSDGVSGGDDNVQFVISTNQMVLDDNSSFGLLSEEN